MHYYKFEIATWHLHTSHLSLIEEAVYWRLINFYYDTETPIPQETQSVIRRLRLGEYSDIVASILIEFFVLQDDGWHQKHCDIKILEYHDTAIRNKNNGKNGGRPKKSNDLPDEKTQSVISGLPKITLTINQEPLNSNTPPTPKGVPCRFEEFWETWPKGERKQDKVKCAQKWKRNELDLVADKILSDIAVKRQTEKWQSGFIEAPLVYLNGKRWEDGVEPGHSGSGGSSDWTGRAI